jgi:hypothetical protein
MVASFNELNPGAGCNGCRHLRYYECYSRRKCALVPDGEPVDIWIATTAAEVGSAIVKAKLEDGRRKAYAAIEAEWSATDAQ